jgi:exopolysaccharide biosynthesis polyprenyl glycosylphosphotransferase
VGIALALVEVGGLFVFLSLIVAWPAGVRSESSLLLALAPAVALAAAWALAFYFFDLYQVANNRTWKEFAPRFVVTLPVTLIVAGAGVALVSPDPVAVRFFYAVPLAIIGLVVPVRAATIAILQRPSFAQKVLLVGEGPLADRIRRLVNHSVGYSIVGVLPFPADAAPDSQRHWAEAHGPLQEALEQALAELDPDFVVMALPERRGCLPTGPLLELRVKGKQVEEGTAFYERLAQKLAIENLTPSNLIYCPELTKRRSRLLAHRAISVLAAVLGILVTAPFMIAAAILVKLDSKGPVFFLQRRVGLRGRVFKLVKFRTMSGDPSPDDGVWNRHDEARITRVGRVLRTTRIDELPQFFNVLVGDMNLVGPRPEMAENTATMTAQIPYYVLRHTIPPGVTGWAQVRQGYAITYEQVLEKTCYDLYYIKNMSIVFDVRILLDTARVLLSFWRPR